MLRISVTMLGAALTILPAHARAQAPSPSHAVSALAGVGRTWDDEGSLGTGVALGGRFERRLFGNTRIEAGVDRLTHDRDSGFFQASGRTTFVSAVVVQRFGHRAVKPYVLGGLTLARHTGEVTFGDSRPQPRRSLDHGLTFGGGLAVLVGGSVEIGPDVRLFSLAPDDDIDPALAWLAGVRVGYRF